VVTISKYSQSFESSLLSFSGENARLNLLNFYQMSLAYLLLLAISFRYLYQMAVLPFWQTYRHDKASSCFLLICKCT